MNRRSLFVIAASVFALTAVAPAAVPDPVRLESGSISGTTGSSGEIRIFRGVPYAAAPVGSLRWKAPRPGWLPNGSRTAASLLLFALSRKSWRQ